MAPWAALPEAKAAADKAEKFIEDETHTQQNSGTTTAKSMLESSDDGEVVHDLARALTQYSIKNEQGEYVNPFDASDSPLLDPRSPKFSPRVWIKNLVGIQSRDPDRYPERVAGVAYRNLSAHGFGEATDTTHRPKATDQDPNSQEF